MAKRNRTVALFEVISKDKRFERSAPPATPTSPGFSRKMAAEAAKLWKQKTADPETITGPNPFKRKRNPVLIPRLKSVCQSAAARTMAIVEIPRQWIIRQDSVISGAVVAFAVIGLVLLVRHLTPRHDSAVAIERQLRAGPAHPAVLLVPTNPPPASSNQPSPEFAADVIQASQHVAQSSDGNIAPKNIAQPNIAQPGQRIVNMHYVLVQSYFDEKTANQARDFLNQNGIPCSIERGVKGWRHDFYQIIGLQGFAHPSGPQYLAYRHRLDELSAKFSPTAHYKRFQPMAIKW
jgi:hypothetical protein